MSLGNLLTIGFDIGDDDGACRHSRAYDADDHWSCLTADVVRPVWNSSSSANLRTYCSSAAVAIASVVEFVR